MNGKEALRAAADYIDEHGWIRESYGKNDGPVCAIGAINVVTGRINGAIGFPEKGGALEAVHILADHLGLEPEHQSDPGANFWIGQAIAEWNDQQAVPGKVTAALRAAAE